MNFNEMISVEASPFQYTEFGLLESVKVQDQLFFPASASAKILGYHNPRKAIIDHCDAPVKLTAPHPQNKDNIKQKKIHSKDMIPNVISYGRKKAYIRLRFLYQFSQKANVIYACQSS